MSSPLSIVAMGAVTAVGLDAVQTCAAIRAGLAGFSTAVELPAPQDGIIGAMVPASRALRQPKEAWLVNLASRAIGQCLDGLLPSDAPALLLAIPDRSRQHPALREFHGPEEIRARIEQRLGERFALFRTFEGGASAGL